MLHPEETRPSQKRQKIRSKQYFQVYSINFNASELICIQTFSDVSANFRAKFLILEKTRWGSEARWNIYAERLLHERTLQDEIQLIWAENTQSINMCILWIFKCFPRLCPTLGTGDVRPNRSDGIFTQRVQEALSSSVRLTALTLGRRSLCLL